MSSDIKQKIVDRVMGKKSAPTADELAVRFGNEMLENLRRNVTAQKEQDAFEVDLESNLNAELDTVLGADVRVLHHTPNHDDCMKADWEPTSHTPLPQDEAKAGAKKYLQSVQPNTRPTLDDLRTENGETEHLHTVQPVFASLPPEQAEMLEAFEYGVSTKLLQRLKEIEHRVEILVTGKVSQ